MFTIDPQDPTNLTLAAQADTGGDFPTSVAVNKDGSNACVINSGSASNLNCFAVGANSLTALNNSQRSLGVNQTAVSALAILVHTCSKLTTSTSIRFLLDPVGRFLTSSSPTMAISLFPSKERLRLRPATFKYSP